MKVEPSMAQRPLRPWDWMGRRGLNMRNPRRIAIEDGEVPCLACLDAGSLVTPHEDHPPKPLSESIPKRWRVVEATCWDRVPLGTTLDLVDHQMSYFVDENGPNSSFDYRFLFTASDGPLAGQSYLTSTSAPATGPRRNHYPRFVEPIDTLTKAEVLELVSRPWPTSCQCGAVDGVMHTPGQGGDQPVCIHDLRALSAHLAPFAALRVRDPSWIRLLPDAGKVPCQCECGCRASTQTTFRADRGPSFLCSACDDHQPPAQGDGDEILRRPPREP